ncbi:MAG: M36 family metallopeptidase [Chitinophagaceae bacterium]|nr:M36 family metallopeptidase [Chitinophagaceae bacterium]
MRRLLFPLKTFILVIVMTSAIKARAQNQGDNRQRAVQLLRKNLSTTGLNQEAVNSFVVTDAYADKRSGNFLVYLQQTYKGIPVYNKISVYIFKNDTLIGKKSDIFRINEQAAAKPVYSVTPTQAVRAAASHLALPFTAEPRLIRTDDIRHRFVYQAAATSRKDISSDLVWLPARDGSGVKLSWNVRIASPGGTDDWMVRVDAATGEILGKSSFVVHERASTPTSPLLLRNSTTPPPPASNTPTLSAAPASRTYRLSTPPAITSVDYRVYPFPLESANFGSRTLENNPWLKAGAGNDATTLGWQFDNSTNYQYTRGNNVWAQQDLAGNNATTGYADTSLTSIPSLTFDRAIDVAASPSAYSNSRAGIDNLFYWNNIMHDISYQYGFDEAAGNFQADNLGRGGLGGDYVNAFALDGAGVNNADFLTPPDGENGRMRIYQFNTGQTVRFHVNSPSAIAGDYTAVEGNLSYKSRLVDHGPITADLVPVVDGSGTKEGCSALTNAAALAGKIALVVGGGNCYFRTKVKYAQNAGAIAVIVTNSLDGPPLTMTGVDTTITIPALMVSDTTANKLYANTTGLNASISATGQYRDGALDNGLISHEYTHGISNRLTGGPANAYCLINAEQMGEGWSDYVALMVTTDWSTASTGDGTKKRTFGTYALGQPSTGPGFRNYPYSTDMGVDPWTYAMLATNTNGEAHNIGEIWCSMLWDMTWNIIQMEGIDADIYHGTKGNNIALQLVIEAMKYQPCSPGFMDGRDAILKADSILYNYAHKCAIWNAFARRGMGKSASQGSSDDYTDGTAAYDLPSGLSLSQSANKTALAQGDHIIYTIKAYCDCSPLTNVSIVDTLSNNLGFISAPGGTYTSPAVRFNGLNFAANETKTLTVEARANGAYASPDTLINDNRESGSYTWTATAKTGSTFFSQSTTRSHSPTHAWYASDAAVLTDFAITSGDIHPDTLTTLSFWHYFETDPAFDGGVVEISTDGGVTWRDLGPYMVQNGYNSSLSPSTSGLGNRQAFTGSSGGVFIRTMASLTGFAGTTARIRFRFASDNSVGSDGWYIDDILLKNESGVASLGTASNGATVLSKSSTVTGLIPGSLPVNFMGFTANKLGGRALLQWQVNSQLDLSSYMVERSGDGHTFSPIGEVPAQDGQDKYSFTDNTPLEGNNFYRIAGKGLDGKLTHSPIRQLQFDASGLTITLSPVPTYTHSIQLTITTGLDDEPATAALISPIGQVIKVYTIRQGRNLLDLGGLAQGIYFLKVSTVKNKSEVRKIVIQ